MVAVAVVEAHTPAPLTFRLSVVVTFDLAMVVPMVARCSDNRKSNQPKRDTCKHASAVAGFSVLDGSQALPARSKVRDDLTARFSMKLHKLSIGSHALRQR